MNHVLFTPPLLIETANSAKYAIYCNMLHASSSPRTGILEIVNPDRLPATTNAYNNVAQAEGPSGSRTFKTAPIALVYGKMWMRSPVRFAPIWCWWARGAVRYQPEAH